MSRFVRLSDGHYINLDLVTDLVVSGPNEDDEWDLTIYYAVPHSEEGQVELTLDYKTEAEAMSVLARILPESTYSEHWNTAKAKNRKDIIDDEPHER